MNKLLFAYAYDFISFLIQNLEDEIPDIKSIILFGSVSRGDATPKSDVDIFIDVIKGSKIEKKVNSCIKNFYSGELYKRYWKLLGINNAIKVIAGHLDDWPDLKNSIIANGHVIYAKYISPFDGKAYAIITWNKINPQSKRVHLNKKLYGWSYRGKKYEGLLAKINGVRLGANVLYIPLENSKQVMQLFRHMKIPVKIQYVSKLE